MSELNIEQIGYALGPNGYEATAPQPIQGVQEFEPVDPDVLLDIIRDADDTYRIEMDRTGRTHESLIFNADQMENGLIFKPSTSFSGAKKNPGNMLETALYAALNPGVAVLYWTSFGNNPTGMMSLRDQAYYVRTGRMTKGDGSDEHPYTALDSIKDLVDMLSVHDRLPTQVTADQEAGRLALGVATELPEGTVSSAYLHSLEGVFKKKHYVRSSVAADIDSRQRRRSQEESLPGEVTPENIRELKDAMPSIYSGLRRYAHIAPIPVIIYPRDDLVKLGVLWPANKHMDLDNLGDHAIYHDMSAAMRRQPMTVTMRFDREDPEQDMTPLYELCADVLNGLPEDLRSPERTFSLLIGEGTATDSTDKPYKGARLQRMGLKFPPILRAIAGGVVLEKPPIEDTPEQEVA